LRFAKRSSTRAGLLVVAVVLAALASLLGIAVDEVAVSLGGLAVATAAAGALAVYLIVSERQRHEAVEEELAARESENARLLAEAREREAERSRLTSQLITAEQDERRRIALYLHDGPVQSMAGIALMLDAATNSIAHGRLDEANGVIESALTRHRDTIRALRDLSFSLEPVVLRDQGFAPAVSELANQVGLANEIQIELDVDVGDTLAEKAQVALYQIIREALTQAIRRGPPTRIAVAINRADDGTIEAVIADDGSGERRRATFDAIAERARTLNGRLSIDQGDDGGTAVRVVLPPYVAGSEASAGSGDGSTRA
jgi:signal transduction histidine kinase